MYAGLGGRLETELGKALTAEKFGGDASRVSKIGMDIIDPPRRKHSVFIGASMFANTIADE